MSLISSHLCSTGRPHSKYFSSRFLPWYDYHPQSVGTDGLQVGRYPPHSCIWINNDFSLGRYIWLAMIWCDSSVARGKYSLCVKLRVIHNIWQICTQPGTSISCLQNQTCTWYVMIRYREILRVLLLLCVLRINPFSLPVVPQHTQCLLANIFSSGYTSSVGIYKLCDHETTTYPGSWDATAVPRADFVFSWFFGLS